MQTTQQDERMLSAMGISSRDEHAECNRRVEHERWLKLIAEDAHSMCQRQFEVMRAKRAMWRDAALIGWLVAIVALTIAIARSY